MKDLLVLFNQVPAAVLRWRNETGWPLASATDNVAELTGYSKGEKALPRYREPLTALPQFFDQRAFARGELLHQLFREKDNRFHVEPVHDGRVIQKLGVGTKAFRAVRFVKYK
jgi:hypothetical protein